MNFAIIDDEEKQSEKLVELLTLFHDEVESNSDNYHIDTFNNGDLFLSNYHKNYDIIFMDIKMPTESGMSVAKKLRNIDSDVKLVFVTQMSQYAIDGYQVGAYDYILKPINKTRFFSMMKRCLRKIEENNSKDIILLKTQYGQTNINISSIRYIEVQGHKCVVHAEDDYSVWLTLSKIEQMLSAYEFFCRINSCYLINLNYVKSSKGYEVNISDTTLYISRDKKKNFQIAMSRHNSK